MNEFQYDYLLIHEKTLPLFGTLIYQVCRRVGITQALLEKYGQAKYLVMQQSGRLVPVDAPPSSMLQPVISLVVNGKQRPSFLQTLVWIEVIKEHHNNEQVRQYFAAKELEMPLFTSELEDALWVLSGHQRPDTVKAAVAAFSDFDYVPHRLPRGMDITPKTDTHIKASHPQEEPHTGPLVYETEI